MHRDEKVLQWSVKDMIHTHIYVSYFALCSVTVSRCFRVGVNFWMPVRFGWGGGGR